MKPLHLFPTLLTLSFTLALPNPSPNLQPRQRSNTRNDLTNGTPCRAMTVIFARGTTEQGNVGTLAGPPFFNALSSAVGADNVAVQGVEYPANVAGFVAGGDRAGSAAMAGLVEEAATKCPDTKIVMSGYSQGGQLVHNAADQLSAGVQGMVSSGKSIP